MADGAHTRPELVPKRTVVIPVSDDCKVVLYELMESLDEHLARLDTGAQQQAAALNLIAHLVYFAGSMVRASESRDILPGAPLPAH